MFHRPINDLSCAEQRKVAKVKTNSAKIVFISRDLIYKLDYETNYIAKFLLDLVTGNKTTNGVSWYKVTTVERSSQFYFKYQGLCPFTRIKMKMKAYLSYNHEGATETNLPVIILCKNDTHWSHGERIPTSCTIYLPQLLQVLKSGPQNGHPLILNNQSQKAPGPSLILCLA